MAISKTQQKLESLWYRKTVWWLWLFLPLNWLLKALVWFRRKFYQWGIFSSKKLAVPVIVIGNINVGGTGKTPLAIYLLQWLKDNGYKPGLVTRGYGGDASEHPLIVQSDSNSSNVGDEPLLIYNRTNAHIVVDHQRARGGQKLIDDFQCDIILCDDGLQHYALHRNLEILVTDTTRGVGNGWLMPFGPLRETPARGALCDLAVVNGETMILEPEMIKHMVKHEDADRSQLQQPLAAVAAIGNPNRFFNTLADLSISFRPVPFPDHHSFEEKDFESFPADIIMTEKDAVKCQKFADERFYYLPISAKLSANTMQQFEQQLQRLKSNFS